VIVVRANDWNEDIVVLTDNVYLIAGDYYKNDGGELVIDEGIAIVDQGDHIAIIGSANGEYAFMYKFKKSEFYKKLLGGIEK